MKNIFWSIVRWLFIPGFTYVLKHPEQECFKKTRREGCVGLILSMTALLGYGTIAFYFFYHTPEGVAWPLLSFVMIVNLMFFLYGLVIFIFSAENSVSVDETREQRPYLEWWLMFLPISFGTVLGMIYIFFWHLAPAVLVSLTSLIS